MADLKTDWMVGPTRDSMAGLTTGAMVGSAAPLTADSKTARKWPAAGLPAKWHMRPTQALRLQPQCAPKRGPNQMMWAWNSPAILPLLVPAVE